MNVSVEIMAITLKNNIAVNAHRKEVFNELFKAYNRYVEDETNGLYSYDRRVCKVDALRMKAIAEQLKIQTEVSE